MKLIKIQLSNEIHVLKFWSVDMEVHESGNIAKYLFHYVGQKI